MSSLFGDILNTVETAMRFRVARQGVLAANVSNADTPGYRRVDLRFEERLAEATRAAGPRDPRHFGDASTRLAARVERDRSPARLDGNNVNLDRELIQLSRNAGAFTEQAAVLSRLLDMRRAVIEQRG